MEADSRAIPTCRETRVNGSPVSGRWQLDRLSPASSGKVCTTGENLAWFTEGEGMRACWPRRRWPPSRAIRLRLEMALRSWPVLGYFPRRLTPREALWCSCAILLPSVVAGILRTCVRPVTGRTLLHMRYVERLRCSAFFGLCAIRDPNRTSPRAV